jgi:hypothetical protein
MKFTQLLWFTGLLAACTEPTPSVSGTAAHFDIVAGDAQLGTVGQPLPTALVVRVTDKAGQAVAGQVINFRVVAGGGSVFAGSAASNSSGLVRELWTLGTVATDSQRLEARAVDAVSGEAVVFGVFTAKAQPGAATHTSKTGDRQTAPVGTAADTLAIKALDRYDNTVPNVLVTWAVTAGGGTLSATQSNTGASGVAKTQLILGNTPGTNTVQATVGDSVVVFTITGVAKTPQHIARMSVATQTGVVGAPVATAPSVKVTDQYGNAVANVSVSFADDSTSSTAISDQAGVATLSTWTLAKRVGSNTLRATVVGVADTITFAATGTPGALSTFGITMPDGTPIPTQQYDTPFTVKVTALDAYGNTVVAYTNTPLIVATGPALSALTATATTSPFVNGTTTYSMRIKALVPAIIRVVDGVVVGVSNSFTISQ